MSSTQPAQAPQENLASVVGQQAVSTLKAAAPALLVAAGAAAVASNPSAAGVALSAAALAETQLPSIMSIANSMNALAQIGSMTPQQVLQYLDTLTSQVTAHQAQLDALDPSYAASVPMTPVASGASLQGSTAPVQNAAPAAAAPVAAPVQQQAA